jgi:hypothetical protein
VTITAQLADQPGIAGQLDLAGGWRDAWRHEMRDAHGRWTRVPGESGEAYGGQFSDQILKYHKWAHGADKQELNLASASLDAGDHEAAVAHLREAARLARANGYGNAASDYQVLAARIEQAHGENAQVHAAVHAFTGKAAGAVPGLLGGGHEAWNGDVDISTFDANPTLLAQINWNGKIDYRDTVAKSIQAALADPHATVADPSAFSVTLHELIHGVIPDGETYPQHMGAYQDKNNAMIEEGFTELGTVHHMPEFLDAMGIGDRPTNVLAATKQGTLAEKLDPADTARAVAEIGNVLDGLPPDDRDDRVRNRLNAARRMIRSGDVTSATNYLAQAMARVKHPESQAALRKLAMDVGGIEGESLHATMAEYAKRLQDPERVEKGNAWGHYPQQTKAAQEWTRQIAMSEAAFGPPGKLKAEAITGGKGPLFAARMREIADEINQQGPAGKTKAMAQQVMRSIGTADTQTDAGRLSELVADTIRKNWQMGSATAAYFEAARIARQWAPAIPAQVSLE